jgi:sensor domain CHASE-containing protein
VVPPDGQVGGVIKGSQNALTAWTTLTVTGLESRGTLDINISTRSHPGFGAIHQHSSFNEQYESLDTSARRDSDIESSGGTKKYLTYVEPPARMMRKSLPDLSGLPTLRESL